MRLLLPSLLLLAVAVPAVRADDKTPVAAKPTKAGLPGSTVRPPRLEGFSRRRAPARAATSGSAPTGGTASATPTPASHGPWDFP